MVPARLLQAILKGSYEQMVDDSSMLVAESFARFGAQSPDEVSVIATFPQHMIVSTVEGKFFRATVKDLEDGGRSIVQTEDVDIPVYRTREEQKGYVKSAASEAVAALLSGDPEEARTHVRELVQSAELISGPDPVEEMRGAMEGLFDSKRPWRRVYESNRAGIHKFTWGESGNAHRDAPKPKYQDLYTNEGVKDPAGYHRAVMADLSVLSERMAEVWDVVQENYGAYDEKETGFYPLTIAGVNESFQDFARDYADELRQVCRLVEAASLDEDPETVIPRAVLYDNVARQFPVIDIAARLVRRTATELSA
jgi:hypothetical protein